MNFAHKVAENIALKKAGLGFIVSQRRAPVQGAERLRMYDIPTLPLTAKDGRAEAGECKIPRHY